MKWPWSKNSDDSADAARAALAEAERCGKEVAPVGRQLADLERANHFSAMVRIAIARAKDA